MDGAKSCRIGSRVSEHIETLRIAIETTHKCKAVHESSVVLVDLFNHDTVRAGVVESFVLTGHPRAKRCYAWSYQENGETQYVNVLEIPPVVSPQTVVKAATVSESRKEKNVIKATEQTPPKKTPKTKRGL
jgi:hypothetical protein